MAQIEERSRIAEREGKVPRDIENEESVSRVMNYIQNELTEEEREKLERDVDIQEVERIVSENNMMLTEDDLKDVLVEDDAGNVNIDPKVMEDVVKYSDMHGVDAFPSASNSEEGENLIYPPNNAFSEKDLADLDDQLAAYKAARESLANQTYFGEDFTMAYMDIERDWPLLSNQTQEEILEVIENSNTMACPEPEMWLLYDLNFNVTNLILASFKHNAEAPIMFTQWMPQLEVYEKYAEERERGFQWTWDDVDGADMEELARYYR